MAMSRSFGCKWFTTRPPMAMVPPLTSSRPAIMRSVVDLPQPEGPTSTTNSRSLTSRLMSLTATTGPYAFCTLVRMTSAIASDPQPAHDVLLSEQGHDQRRNERDHRGRAHEMPLHAELMHELRHDHGQDRGFMRRQNQREQELVPGIEPAQDRERGEAGDRGWHGHAPERSPARAAVDHRRIFHRRIDAVEESLHDPGEEADVDGDVREKQSPIGVEDAEPLRNEIERHNPGDIGNATKNVDERNPGVMDGSLEARQHVARRRRYAEGKDRCHGRDHEAVEQRSKHDLLRQHLVEVVDRKFGPAMHVVDTGSRPQRGQYQPEHREREERAHRYCREREKHGLAARRERGEEAGFSARAGEWAASEEGRHLS